MKKETKKQIFTLLVLFIFLGSGFAFALMSAFPSKTRTHRSAKIFIYVNNMRTALPNNAGNNNIHTENYLSDFSIHFYGDINYTLGDFFDAAGIVFNNVCLGELCNNETHSLKMFVNKQENNEFENYILQDGDKIELEYNSI